MVYGYYGVSIFMNCTTVPRQIKHVVELIAKGDCVRSTLIPFVAKSPLHVSQWLTCPHGIAILVALLLKHMTHIPSIPLFFSGGIDVVALAMSVSFIFLCEWLKMSMASNLSNSSLYNLSRSSYIGVPYFLFCLIQIVSRDGTRS
jgi:hypothetical protein